MMKMVIICRQFLWKNLEEKMYDYAAEIKFLEKVEEKNNKQNERTKLNESEIDKIKGKYENIPDDYLDYLKFIGWGSFRECHFMVFECPEKLSNIIGEVSENDDINNAIIFGDGFAGDLFGFDLTKEGKVIEFHHELEEIHETGKTFKEYIRKKMGMDNFGNDTWKK